MVSNISSVNGYIFFPYSKMCIVTKPIGLLEYSYTSSLTYQERSQPVVVRRPIVFNSTSFTHIIVMIPLYRKRSFFTAQERRFFLVRHAEKVIVNSDKSLPGLGRVAQTVPRSRTIHIVWVSRRPSLASCSGARGHVWKVWHIGRCIKDLKKYTCA